MGRRASTAEVEGLRTAARAIPSELSTSELASTARTICALLAERFPGGTVELRVPPYAAVQLGLGERGRHTRGTPPNVVQTDPLTLLALAAGTLTWPQAREQRLVQASGVLADLAEIWPLAELG